MSAPAAYDPIAWLYDRYWAGPFHGLAIDALDRLLLGELPPGALLLDVCCGSGQVARALSGRGFRVVGLDRSPAMLRHARRNAPGAAFVVGDAARFALDARAAGALATFDAVNHLLDPADVRGLLASLARALAPGARFVFDVLTEEAYDALWTRSGGHVAADDACFVEGAWDRAARRARMRITAFRRDGTAWQRVDQQVEETAYDPAELASFARDAGFASFEVHDARRDLGQSGDFAVGRAWCVAIR